MEQHQILDDNITKQSVNVNVQYAGFWIRFGAYIIDAIILGIPLAILNYVILDFNYGEPNFAPTLINIIVQVCYFSFMESSAKRATLGKLAVGIEVISYEYEQISVGKAIGRYLSKFISALILLIGYIMAGFDDRKQALHDKMASTYVVYKMTS